MRLCSCCTVGPIRPRSSAARTAALYPRNVDYRSPTSALAAKNPASTLANDASPEASWNSAILANFCAYALRVPARHDRAAQASGPLGLSSVPSMHQRDQTQRKERARPPAASTWPPSPALVDSQGGSPGNPPTTVGVQLQWGHWKCQCRAGIAAPFCVHLLQFADGSDSTGIHSQARVCQLRTPPTSLNLTFFR